jgi:hypothetical protein
VKKIITIQPGQITDNIWVGRDESIVEGQMTPYPFSVDAATGDVEDQNFWKGDPKRVVGFQAYVDRQQVDLWWEDAAKTPDLIVGMFPVMVGPDGLYTYTIAIESIEITEVEK